MKAARGKRHITYKGQEKEGSSFLIRNHKSQESGTTSLKHSHWQPRFYLIKILFKNKGENKTGSDIRTLKDYKKCSSRRQMIPDGNRGWHIEWSEIKMQCEYIIDFFNLNILEI